MLRGEGVKEKKLRWEKGQIKEEERETRVSGTGYSQWGGGVIGGAPSLSLVSSSLCLQQKLIYCPSQHEDPLLGCLPLSLV